jgi:hypothetical protein
LYLDIFSKKKRSPLYGAQYLHRPIPFVTDEDSITVTYTLRGSSDDYRRKVYGRMWTGTVSPEDLIGEHTAWDIRTTYKRLWDAYAPAVKDSTIEPASIGPLLEAYDLVINSIPRPQLCTREHHFGATVITAAGDAPELGIRLSNLGYRCPENMVVCNGEEAPQWYRMSNVFGHMTIEWPDDDVPVKSASRVRKPTDTNCDCWPAVMHVGRYGSWSKGVLSHTAYFDTLDAVSQRLANAS